MTSPNAPDSSPATNEPLVLPGSLEPTSTEPARDARAAVKRSTTEPLGVRVLLIALALAFLGLFLVTPLLVVFHEAFREGLKVYKVSITDPDALSAIKLTLLIAAIALPLNTIFGLAAAWSIAKFRFKGRSLLVTLLDLPFAVSPVIAGLVFVLIFGARGILGTNSHWIIARKFTHFLEARDIKIIFAVPGMALATLFVTFPFVARELIAFMEAQGTEEEEAAIVLGASGWQTFWRVTVPNIKWGLLYGIILCNARAMGEFGAVSVVSSHVAGETNTIPLQVETLYDDYHYAAAFSVASLLTLLGIITLIIKRLIEARAHRQLLEGQTQ